MKKRILLLFLAIIISICTISVNVLLVNGANVANLLLENATAKIGDEVTLSLVLKNDPGIMNINAILKYDRSKLHALNVEKGNVFGSCDYNLNYIDGVNILFSGSNDNIDDGILCKIKFEVLSSIEGEKIYIELTGKANNKNDEYIVLKTESGYIQIPEVSKEPTTKTEATTEKVTEPTTKAVTTTEKQAEATTKAPTTQATTEKHTEATTKAPTTQATTEKHTEATTKALTTQATTEKQTEATTKAPTTQATTEKHTEATTKANVTMESSTEAATATTENSTEITTKKVSSSGKGGGAGASSLKVINYDQTTTNEVSTEITTESETEEQSVDFTQIKVTIGSTIITINDKEYEMDAAPYIQAKSNSTLVPLRFVAIAILEDDVDNADNSSVIEWDPDSKTANVYVKGTTIQFTPGSNMMIVARGVMVQDIVSMDNGVKAEIKDGRMYIPFRALGEVLRADVEWAAESKTAIYSIK